MSIINDSKENYYILDDYSIEDSVKYEASEYWYIDLFVIALDDVDSTLSSSNQKYMLLEYPSYTEVNVNNKINDCIWSVPYMAYLFQKPGTKRFKTIKAIKNFYENEITQNSDLFEELENYRFYHMGISDYNKIDGNHYIEYKISARQPDKWKCYYIQEHYITGIDSLGILNLIDPEGLHGYRYLPLIPKPKTTEENIFFADKRLASNVSNLIKKSYNKIMQYSNPINSSSLRYNVYGLVFKIDIIGFTETYNKIVNEMKSLDETGKEIAVHFIAGISSIFEKRMLEFGISQFVVEGDGVTGAVPLNCENDNGYGLELVIKCAIEIKNDIDKLVDKIDKKLNIRCSITTGNYIYGKLAGLSSNKQIAGEIMIFISRMDQYLKSLNINDFNLPMQHILFCIDTSVYNDHIDYFNRINCQKMVSCDKFRETKINSTIIYMEV